MSVSVSGRRKGCRRNGGGVMGKGRKPAHECELCRTLGDVVRALEPGKYRCGPELEIAEGIQTALGKHLRRVSKTKGGTVG